MCQTPREKDYLVLTDVYSNWEDCYHACPKFKESQEIDFVTKIDFQNMVEFLEELLLDPMTGAEKSGVVSASVWTPVNDMEEEGKFVHHYTGEPVDIDIFFNTGEPNGGDAEDCTKLTIAWQVELIALIEG